VDTLPTPPSPVLPSSPEGSTAAAAPLRRLRRFVVAERVSHWLYALFFLTAFVTGLLMWVPATREWMAGSRRTFTLYHGYVGAAMVILPLLLFFLLDRRRLARDLREVDKWDRDDRHWFWLALRGYTLRAKEMPPQGRFNAGQKVNVVLVAAMAVGFSATGGILMHKQDMPAWLVSRALWLHDFLVIVAVAIFLGHLAHVFLTRHGRTSLTGMVTGWVPEDLARERHQRWWEEETGGAEEAAGAEEAGGEPSGGADAGDGGGV
jgi:formate dehydrogenase subunit gamma